MARKVAVVIITLEEKNRKSQALLFTVFLFLFSSPSVLLKHVYTTSEVLFERKKKPRFFICSLLGNRKNILKTLLIKILNYR